MVTTSLSWTPTPLNIFIQVLNLHWTMFMDSQHITTLLNRVGLAHTSEITNYLTNLQVSKKLWCYLFLSSSEVFTEINELVRLPNCFSVIKFYHLSTLSGSRSSGEKWPNINFSKVLTGMGNRLIQVNGLLHLLHSFSVQKYGLGGIFHGSDT